MIRLPSSCLVVLVGPSGSGKSTWAAAWFDAGQVVSADGLRALVGEGEHDQRAGTDAFAVLDLVLDRRLKRGLLTVVDTLGLDRDRRRGYVALARRHGRPVVAVAFDDVSPAECRARNAARRPGRPVPPKVLTAQLARWPAVVEELADDGFDAVHRPGPVRVVDPHLVGAPEAARRQQEDPLPLDFGLQIATYGGPGGAPAIGPHLSSAHVVADHGAPASVPVRALVGTVEEHVGRFRELAETGVQTAIVRMAPNVDVAAVERFAPVLAAFRAP